MAYALRSGVPEAVAEAADEIAAMGLLDEGAVFVPVPGARGPSAGNLALAAALAEIMDGDVVEAVERARPVESSRVRRRAGLPGLTREDHARSMAQAAPLPPDAAIWLVDNVVTTGATMLGAWDALGRPPGVRGVAWAKAEGP